MPGVICKKYNDERNSGNKISMYLAHTNFRQKKELTE